MLVSVSCGLDVGWIQKHQGHLQRFITTPLLEGALSHMRKLELLSQDEEAQVQAGGQLQEQVGTLTSILASMDPQGSNALQAFLENSDSQTYRLITMHGEEEEPIGWHLVYRLECVVCRIVNCLLQVVQIQIVISYLLLVIVLVYTPL
jgi:hypothetical protein